MRSTMRGVIGVWALAAVCVVAVSCSDSNVNSGSEGLVVKYKPNPTGAGRFERGSFGIASIKILPNDPATVAIYGSTQLSIIFRPFTADITATKPVTLAQIALASGSYRVTELQITSPSMVDTNVSATPATCIDGVAGVPSGPATGQVPPTLTFNNVSSLAFTVRPGQTTLSFTVDIPRLVSEFQAEFTCNPDCGGGQPCLVGFDAAAYRDTMLAVISVQ